MTRFTAANDRRTVAAMGRLGLAICAAVAAAALSPAHAGPESEIASAFDEGDGFDLHTSLHYRFSTSSAAVRRELGGSPGIDPDGTVPLGDDLRFSSSRHELVPRLELGVFTDLALSIELPVVIRDTRELRFDDGVNRANSTTISDGLLPMSGFDARDPTGPGFTDGDMIFRGVDRTGLDQLIAGIAWAPMNQVRDATKPTWKLGAELRLSVGSAAKFNRADPDSQSGVGRGVHEVKLWTTVTRRRGWAEALFELSWMATFTAKQSGQLDAPQRRFGAAVVAPQQHAGARAGMSAIFFERKADQQRVSLDVEANFNAHFEGRGYGEMWEVFAYAGDIGTSGPLVLDSDPATSGIQEISHPGVSNIQNYATIGTKAAVSAELGPKVRASATFGFDFDQAHFVSFADAGRDRPQCTAGQTTDCENDNNDVVNDGTDEVNPLHADLIDTIGHRYKVSQSRRFWFMVEGRFLF